MDQETKEIFREILLELKTLNSTTESSREEERQVGREIQTGVATSNMWQASSNIASIAGNAANSLASGDLRNMATLAATGVGAALGGPQGAAVGNAAGQSASAIAGLFAPRGYNAFNVFESHDRTVTDPYKRAENLYAQYARYGVKIPKDQMDKWYAEDKKLSSREQAAREQIRSWYGDETSAWQAIKKKAGNLFSGLSMALYDNANNGGSVSFGDGMDKAISIAKKQQRNVKSITRQDRFDDDY